MGDERREKKSGLWSVIIFCNENENERERGRDVKRRGTKRQQEEEERERERGKGGGENSGVDGEETKYFVCERDAG